MHKLFKYMKTTQKFFWLFALVLLSFHSKGQVSVLSGQLLEVDLTNFNPNGYIVESGGELLFPYSEVYNFNPDKGIHVNTGGRLYMTGGIFTCNTFGENWSGFSFDAETSFNPDFVASIDVKNNFTISRAERGIHCKSLTTTGNVGFAADIRFAAHQAISQFVFIDNEFYDIFIENVFDAIAPKANNSFLLNVAAVSLMLFQGSTSPTFKANVGLQNTSMVNTFSKLDVLSPTTGFELENSKINVENSIIHKMLVGVSNENNINISGSSFVNCILDKPETGFLLLNSGDMSISNNEFNDVVRAFTSNESENIFVSNNTLNNILDYFYRGYNDVDVTLQSNSVNMVAETGIGAIVGFVGSSGIEVTSNVFEATTGIAEVSAVKFIDSELMYIGNNKFHGFLSNHCTIDNSKTTTICGNKFYSPVSVAVRIMGVLVDQGSTEYGFDNEFFLSNGEYRVVSDDASVAFYNTQPLTASQDPVANNLWSVNATHQYISSSFLCRPPPFIPKLVGENSSNDELKETDVYPNPFTDIITLSSTETLKEVKVYSLEGKLVRYITNITTELYLGDLQAGAYLIHLVDKNNYRTIHKVVKSQ